MSSNVCGTGNWSGPLPGDPDTTNILLTATPAFGGIDVSWTDAVTNPHAVAHTYLYRSISSDFATAVRIAKVGGTHHYDKLETLIRYYYWIQIVSINGTVGEVIGPASAVPRLSINETIIALTGRIDNGMLAQSLKTDIDKITLTAQDLDQEILDRVADTEYLGSQLTLLDNGVNASFGLVLNEINTLADNHNALAQSYSYLASSGGGNSSAIKENNRAMIGYCLVGGVTSSENTPAECSAAGGTWVVAAPLAESVKTVQITDNDGNIASVQQLMQSYKDGLGDLGALYTAKVGVNGLIGGFGVYNDGTEVQAGFDVDTFWVGRTGPDKKKPFIIDSNTGKTYIDKAVIPTLTADMIDTRGLSIKDTNGNIILAAGTALDWGSIGGVGKTAVETNASTALTKANTAQIIANNAATTAASAQTAANNAATTAVWSSVSGTGKPQDNATVGATFGDYYGSGKNISGTITPGNITTYIANAAIGNAQFGGDLWSTNWSGWGGNGWLLSRSGSMYLNNVYARGDIEASRLKAGAAMVETLHIKGNAVTTTVHAYTAASTGTLAPSGWGVWVTVQSAYCNPEGGQVSVIGSATIFGASPGGFVAKLRIVSPSGASAESEGFVFQMNDGRGQSSSDFWVPANLVAVGAAAEAGVYLLQVNASSWHSVKNRSLLLMGSKR